MFEKLFTFDSDSGSLVWKERDFEATKNTETKRGSAESKTKRWNSRYAGKIAGTKRASGSRFYITVEVNTKPMMAHRIIWMMNHGDIPEGFEVDHIDHDGTNNRLENLRLVDRSGNMKNRSKQTNKSGVHGVHWYESNQCWVAQCQSGGVRHRELYKSFDDACEAIKRMHEKYKFHKNHGS